MPQRHSMFAGLDPQARGLLDDVLEHREDDAPRLIFADWLEDNGQLERAEFIRLQIERYHLHPRDPKQPGLQKRERGLLRKYARSWFAPPQGWQIGGHVFVHRGFPDHVSQSAKALFAHPEVFDRWPITRLRIHGLNGSPEMISRLASSPFLARIRDLVLLNQLLGPDGLEILLESPWLEGLVRLDLSNNALGDQGARLLARRCLDGLRELDIRHNDITARGQRALIRSKARRSLRLLCLCGNSVSGEVAAALLESPDWPELTDLSLWNTRLGDAGLERLVACPALLKLTALNLNLNLITDRGLEMLAGSPHVANLQTLLLAVNSLSSKSGSVLIGSPWLAGLSSLNLYGNDSLHWQTRRKLREHFGDRVSFTEPW
jgi:uncharacterized protein (TIGR02996 family)